MKNATKPLTAIMLAALAALCLGCSDTAYMGVDLRGYVPRGRIQDVRSALDMAGDNATEVLEAITSAPEEDRDAMSFLVANLPPVDLATADAEFLLENVRLAGEARERFSWGASVPDDVYLAYVLPPRVSQEPLEEWRPFMLEQLTGRLEGITSMEEAALEVNRWCGERVGYRPTQRRDQGVFETLASGYGRCEEMMIVHISALRSVCIPARQTWTPYWATSDNNHAWTELWVDGEWRYAGACEPADALDKAWFTDTAKGAAIVLSSVFGPPAEGDEVYREDEGFSLVNSVSRYLEPGGLDVAVVRDGAPAKDVPVTVSVWNFGALRAVGRQDTDDKGRVHFTMGDGTYFVCAGGSRESAWNLAEVSSGETTEAELELAGGTPFDASFRLNYDTDGE